MPESRCLRREDYTVGWISALPLELAAATKMLDEEHHALPQDHTDTNVYTLGSIGEHNVVMACLPVGGIGTNSAAAVANRMRTRFPSIRFGLLVGIGGGVPSAQADIRLGDVVVSQPSYDRGGVVQYDFGIHTPSGLQRTGFINAPPEILLSALAKFQADNLTDENSLYSQPFKPVHTSHLLPNDPGPDILFAITYDHVGGDNCEQCDITQMVKRSLRKDQQLMIHYGTIASGNQVIKDGKTRDQLSSELDGVLCFEMEAAGVMNTFPCLVIRGICDYADSHKSKRFQPYAASIAAVYAKELLFVVPHSQITSKKINNVKTLPWKNSSGPPSQSGGHEWDLVEEELFAVPAYISDYEPDRTWEGHLRTKCPGTARWILESDRFKAWLEHRGLPCLWLTGKIGSGKTLVTSTLVEQLLLESKETHDLVAHFFYSYSQKTRLEGSDLFRSYIKQMIEHLDTTRQPCPPDISFCLRRFFGLKASPPTFDEIVDKMFVPLSRLLPHTTYVVDGLDECPAVEIQRVLRVFRILVSQQGLRIFVSGRESLDIQQSIPGSSLVYISNNDAKEDICKFVEWKVEEKMHERQLTEDKSLLRDVKTTLVDKADCMILWVSLQIDCLWEDCFTDANIRIALADMPKDLDETYARCVARMNSQHLRFAPKVLRWVCAAIKPFTVIQLREALAINPSNGLFDKEKMPSTQDVLRCCANLITRDSEGYVIPAHHSVRQFLLARNADTLLFPNGFNPVAARLELGKLSVTHLCSSHYSLSLQKSTRGSNDFSIRLKPTAAAMLTENIPSIIRSVLPKPKELHMTIPPGFLSQPQSLAAQPPVESLPSFFEFAREQWAPLTIEINQKSDYWHDFRTLSLQPNLSWRFHPWAPHGQSLDSHYLGLLGWATVNRHMPMLDLLLDPGGPQVRRDIFEIPIHQYGNLSALHLAARSSDEAILKRVLGRCNLQKRDLNGRTALHHAADVGSLEVATLLVIQSAARHHSKEPRYPSYRDDKGKTPLHLAAENGHTALVKRLLDFSYNLHDTDKEGSNALELAVANGHEQATLVLVSHGARLKSGRNPLEDPARKGDLRLLELAFDQDIEVGEVYLADPLRAAAEMGHETVVKFLLNRGASIGGVSDESPLFLAARNGHEAVVKLLLDRGMYMDGSEVYIPLRAASENGHEAVIKLLLDRGLTSWGKMYGPSLISFAARHGHRAVVKLLLDRDASLDGGKLYVPLRTAVVNGHAAVVRLLLDQGIKHRDLSRLIEIARNNDHWAIEEMMQEFEGRMTLNLEHH